MASASVVIPAHNEEATIARCLKSLLASEVDHVCVVANGCVDSTAAVAAGYGPSVHVIETPAPSKSNALNAGDAAAEGFPRFYIDADIFLEPGAIEKVSQALTQPGVLAAAPLIRFDTSHCPWSVRAFYDVWSQLPYLRKGMIGCGVYAVSEEGRRRFGRFPDITADDEYVRLQFAPDERRTVESCRFTVTTPRTLSGVIKIKTRAYFGGYELRTRFPELFVNKKDNHDRALLALLRQPRWWPKIAVYVYVRGVSRILGYWRFRFGNHQKWERDDTSRQSPLGEENSESQLPV